MADAFKVNWDALSNNINTVLIQSYNTVIGTYVMNLPNTYRVKMWDGTYIPFAFPFEGTDTTSIFANSSYVNIADRWNYYYSSGYSAFTNRGGTVTDILYSTVSGNQYSNAWMWGATTDTYSINRYINKFVPSTSSVKPNGYGTEYCPVFGYNPILTYANPASCEGMTRDYSRDNYRFIRIRAVNYNGWGALAVQTSNDGSSWTTTYLDYTCFRNGIVPNRLGLLAAAAGGGGYNGTSGTYGGGGAGAWCAIVLNTYVLKEDTNRYYTIDLGATAHASKGSTGSNLTIRYSSRDGTSTLITLGGGVGATRTSGGTNGGAFTVYASEGSLWWRLINGSNSSEFTNTNFGGRSSSGSTDTVYVATNSFVSALVRSTFTRTHSSNYYGAPSIFSNSVSGQGGPGCGGCRNYTGGCGYIRLFY